MTAEPDALRLVPEPLACTLTSKAEVFRITLCGSTKFRAEYELWNKRLTLAGFIVYSVSGFGHSGDAFTDEEKARLDQVHLAKIDASHAIVVLNVGGYIGDSTAREIAHAKATGKQVYYLEGDNIVYRLRTGPDGASSLRYRAFGWGAAAPAVQPAAGREALASAIELLMDVYRAASVYEENDGNPDQETRLAALRKAVVAIDTSAYGIANLGPWPWMFFDAALSTPAQASGEPFMYAYENMYVPGEWRAYRHQLKRADGSICPGKPLYAHPPAQASESGGEALDPTFESWLKARDLLPPGSWDWSSIVAMLDHHEAALSAPQAAPGEGEQS